MPASTQIPGSVTSKILRFTKGEHRVLDDLLVVEEPIEMAVRCRGELTPLGISMRTPGDDRHLLLGFLHNESVIRSIDDVASIDLRTEKDATLPATRITATLHDHIEVDSERLSRAFPISSACGACGKSALEALKVRRQGSLPFSKNTLPAKTLSHLGKRLADDQSLFTKTGGLHASGRFTLDGALLQLAEDVGRHNALDKLVGAALDSRETDWSENLLLLSGRVGYDLMQKAIMIGCPIVASIGAPSSLAVELAALYKITLVGFLKEDRFNLYSAPERIQ